MEQPTPQLQSTFPRPPRIFEAFTPEAWQAHKFKTQAAAQHSADADVEMSENAEDEPGVFEPPEPPASDGSYVSFGSAWKVDEKMPELKDFGIEQLAPVYRLDVAEERRACGTALKKMLHSVLVVLMQLLVNSSRAPQPYPELMTRLRTLLLNMHFLLNQYRPHQTRETLVLMMQEQLRVRQARLEEMRRISAESRKLIDAFHRMQAVPRPAAGAHGQRRAQVDGAVWDRLRAIAD